jgi:hypothetical protein
LPAGRWCETLFDREHRGGEELAKVFVAGASNAEAVLVAARVPKRSLDEQTLRLLELSGLAADGGRGGGRR